MARTDEVRVLLMTIFCCSFLTFWYVMHSFSFSCSVFEKSGKIDVQNCKISRLSLLVSRPWSGPLRHVYDYTNHSTTMVHTFLESPSNLDVHPGIRFEIFEKNSSELASKKYTIWLCHAHEGGHCVTFAGKLLTLQQLFIHFWKAQPT